MRAELEEEPLYLRNILGRLWGSGARCVLPRAAVEHSRKRVGPSPARDDLYTL